MVPNGAPNRYPSGCFTAEKSKQIRTCFPRFLSSVRPSVHPFVPLPLRAIVFVPARPILPCPLQCASPSQHTTPEHVLSRVRNVPTICSFLPLSLSHSLSLSLYSRAFFLLIPPFRRSKHPRPDSSPPCAPLSSLTPSCGGRALTRARERAMAEKEHEWHMQNVSLSSIFYARLFAGIYDAAVGILLLPIHPWLVPSSVSPHFSLLSLSLSVRLFLLDPAYSWLFISLRPLLPDLFQLRTCSFLFLEPLLVLRPFTSLCLFLYLVDVIGRYLFAAARRISCYQRWCFARDYCVFSSFSLDLCDGKELRLEYPFINRVQLLSQINIIFPHRKENGALHNFRGTYVSFDTFVFPRLSLCAITS